MNKHWLVSLVFLVCASACGDSVTGPIEEPIELDTSPAPRPAQARTSITLTPATVNALPSGIPNLPWSADVTVRVRETAGTAANVNFINFETPGLSSLNFGAKDIIALSGSNHVPANGLLDAKISIAFSVRGGGGGRIPFTTRVNLTDANGNRSESTAEGVIVVPTSGQSGPTSLRELIWVR